MAKKYGQRLSEDFKEKEIIFYNFKSNNFISRKEAGVEIDGNFMIRVIYNDDATYALVTASSKVLSNNTKC